MHAKSRRAFIIQGLAGVGALAGGVPAVAADETLTLYSGQHRSTTEAAVAAFTKATGIGVVTRQGESSQLSNQIIEEGANSPADVFYSEQSPPLMALDERGLLAETDGGTLSQIPAAYASARKTWIGTCMRVRVLAYNKAMLAQTDLPASILDVAGPAWRGRIGYVTRDGFQEQILAVNKLKGRDAALAWLTGLKENGRLYNGNGAAMKAVEAGEVAAALTNNYYWFALATEAGAEKMKSALHYFPGGDAGALINLSPAAALKTSKKQALAQKLLAFLVSEAGQAAIMATSAEYPVRPGMTSPFPLKPLSEIGQTAATADEIGGGALAYALEREAGMI